MKTRTLIAAALSLGLAACSSEFSPVSIFATCAPPDPDSTSGSCVYPAECGANLAGTPVLDATTAKLDFRLSFQMNNALPSNASTADGRINTNDAFVQTLEMTYPGAGVDPWNVSQAVTVPSAGNAGALLRLIPQSYFATLAPAGTARRSIIINVRAHGILASQDSFTTAWYQVPVEVCSGCLAGTFCAPGSFLATCPSTAPGETSPGQTASAVCITPAAARQ
jgi:hypothetical protein